MITEGTLALSATVPPRMGKLVTVSERGRTEKKGKEAEQFVYLGTASLDLWPGNNQDPQAGEDLRIVKRPLLGTRLLS